MIVDNITPGDPAVLRIAIDMPRHTLFDYLPPDGVEAAAVPLGVRVRAPIGARECVGLVVEHAERPSVSAATLRPLKGLIDQNALFDASLLQLLRWTAQYYHHPLGEVISMALPRALREGNPALPQLELWRCRPTPAPGGVESIETRSIATPLHRAPQQRALLALLAQHPTGLPSAAIAEQLPNWRAAARALEAKGYVERRRCDAPTTPAAPAGAVAEIDSAPQLTTLQVEAVETIDAARDSFAAFVLQGATGSGKSEVYLQCAARALERGRGVLVLVPEIALTPQLVERFRRRLRAPVAVLHSGLTDLERLAAWRQARAGAAPIVLGTRSAVFAPLPHLGLIVVDEEHDGSYKQYDSGCRYSARDLAVARASQAHIPVVLGSATPAFETLHNLELGRYRRLTLPRRADQPEAPRLALIDLRAHAVHQGLSTPVIEAMRRHLGAGAQALVFINRRGYAPTLLCTACGWIAPCHACDARLTVHRAAAELRCHHCGAAEPLPERCPRCGFAAKPVGQGTERIEQTLQQLFPDQPLLRLDRDTATDPEALETLMRSVRDGTARILVGTQMVTKGHHFPGISLAVVLNADQGLFSTDFRAPERLAQIIVQVAGRAGRERSRGEVLIQTEYPDHPLLQSLLAGGYEGFAATALAERAAARWPPFGRLALLRASAPSAPVVLEFLHAARAVAPPIAGVRVLGPVAAAMARRAGRCYAQLLLESNERTALHRLLDQWLPLLAALPSARRVRFALDVDPLDIQ